MRDLLTELLENLTTEDGITLVTEEADGEEPGAVCHWGVMRTNSMCGAVRSNTFGALGLSNTYLRRREPTQ
jgi:hypothetical protein